MPPPQTHSRTRPVIVSLLPQLNFSTSPPCPPLPSFHTFFPSPPSLVPASPCSSYSMSPSNSSPLLLSLPPTQTQTQTQVILENVIPEDVLPLVCSFLQARELLTIGMASKSMNAISNDPTLWIRLVSSVFGTCVDELSPPDAQEVYKVMNRRLRDLKAGALECTWSKEMRLRGHSI